MSLAGFIFKSRGAHFQSRGAHSLPSRHIDLMTRACGGFGEVKPAILVRAGAGEHLLNDEYNLQYLVDNKVAGKAAGKPSDKYPKLVVQADFSPRGINEKSGQHLQQTSCTAAMVSSLLPP